MTAPDAPRHPRSDSPPADRASQLEAFQDPGHPGFRADHLMLPREVADLFRVSTKTVHRWAQTGVLNSVKTIGGHYRICRQSVTDWLQQQRST